MPIIKDVTTPNGALTSYHLVRAVDVNLDRDTAVATVLSFANEAAWLAGAGVVWSTNLTVPFAALAAPISSSLEEWIVADSDSAFTSGSIVPKGTDFESTKARKWAEIKNARDVAMSGPLVTPYGTFDADRQSRGNITDAVLMLQTLAAMGQPTFISFTLADNTDVDLDTTQMVTVGLLLGAQVQEAFGIGRALRNAIDAATTVEELNVIVWP